MNESTSTDPSTNHLEFRNDLIFEASLTIGHYSRKGKCFIDDTYESLRRKLLGFPISVPRTVQNILKDVRFSKLDKWIEISKDANEETCRKYQALTEMWNSYLKIPQHLGKLAGKNEHLWKSTIFLQLYKFIIKDFDQDFEEDREMYVPLLKQRVGNVFFIGMQKTKTTRELMRRLKKKRSIQIAIGDVYLPFFGCKELGDKGSQFQAENELSCALKTFLDCRIGFFQEAKQSKQFVVGLTCVGALATAYLMRKIVSDQEETHYVMQPLNTFNLGVYDDLFRLAKFLTAVRGIGEDVVKNVNEKLRILAESGEESDTEKESQEERVYEERKVSPKRKLGETADLKHKKQKISSQENGSKSPEIDVQQ